MNNGVPEVIRDSQGAALVPSCLSFPDGKTMLVGSAARERALAEPETTIFSVKRLMGRTLADLEEDLPLIPQQIVEREIDAGRKVLRVQLGDKEYAPEELSAMILREVCKRAGNPKQAVITVPAYFDDAQRQATRDAGRIAGLDVLRIINEPTAAALAYGLNKKEKATIVVYDLGGGTFDCSILSLNNGTFRVLSTNGDTHLGGDDFDRILMELWAKDNGISLNEITSPSTLQHLRMSAEQAKIELSSTSLATIDVDDFERFVVIDEFNALIQPLIDRTLRLCQSALKDAELTPADCDEVVLVGGSTRVPAVRQAVETFFGRTPHTELNPDEVVALGAAVQADILTGGDTKTLLLDVIPLSLGIETLGGVVDKVIHRNTTVPCRETTRYSTFVENQTAIKVNIYQGERELIQDCRLLGEFKLGGIPPMPAQMPQVDVTFLVDANGILTVSAKELRSGQQAQVEVKAAHGLSQDEVESLVLESVEHAHSDFAARQFIELKNKADADIRHTDKALFQAKTELSATQLSTIETSKQRLQTAMAGNDVAELQRASDAFGQATTPLAEVLMNAAAKQLLHGKGEQDIDANI